MKKYIFISIVLLLTFFNAEAQIKVESEVDLTDFPNVSFNLHNRDPNFKTEKKYNFLNLTESSEVLIDSVSVKKINDTINYSKKNKCVLILVESINNPKRYEQVNTFFKALNNSLDEFVNSGDKIQIAVFHLRGDDTRVIVPLNNNFTDDVGVLKKGIRDFDASSNREKKLVSEIPGAILEGIDLLAEIPENMNKSILLMSEESTNKFSTQKSFVNVIDIAQEKEIVINTIKYNRYDHRQHAIPFLANQTYGESHVLEVSPGNLKNSNKKKQIQAEKIISTALNNSVRRSYGSLGRATIFLNDAYNDGREIKIKIKELNSNYSHEFNFEAPGNWYLGQLEKNLLITSITSLLILFILFLIFKKIKTMHELKKIKLLDEKQNQIQIQEKQKSEILKQQNEIASLKELEQKRLNDLDKAKLLKEKKNLEEKLIKEMITLGNFPVLKFIDSKNSNSFEINRPKISVGRDESNDIHIMNPNISRKHFTIYFESSNYIIKDNNSTNGMIINGYKLKKSTLKNGDVIEIADATFTFYQ